jgi:acyl-CoA synthetase (AMP-forming)/AMP-acid ligase II
MLSRYLRSAADRFAEHTCLIDGSRSWTFAEFDNQCDRVARGLREMLRPGERVALFMSNRAEYLLLQFAVERASLVRVPINARSTANDLQVILIDCGATALFCDMATFDRTTEALKIAPAIWMARVDSDIAEHGPAWTTLLHHPVDHAILLGDPDDLTFISYTSGSTGRPKGVMLNGRQWLAVIHNLLIDRDIRGTDIVAHIGPLTHASGIYFYPWFLRGACSILIEGGRIENLLKTIATERVTVFTCVPTVLTRIVNHPDIDRYDLSSVRAIGYGAEPIPRNTLEKAVARFGKILTQNYGQTEGYMTIAHLSPEDHFLPTGELRVGSIGVPYTFVEVILRAPDGSPVGTGEMGEITVRSDHVMTGYWNMPEETAKTHRGGWLWTGDLARCDTDGFLYLMGRSKEMLISGGYNIYPAEIEAVLTSHPKVLEAAVIGVPDSAWGEVAVAFVAIAPNASIDTAELVGYCRPLLGFRVPKRFVYPHEIPKNANGKIDKKKLKDQFLSVGG